MPSTSENFPLPRKCDTDYRMVDFNQDLSAPGTTEPLRLRQNDDGGVVFHLTGTATSFTAQVERSTRDPLSDPNWAPAEDELWVGDLSMGVAPRLYCEPVRGWWRLRVSSISGGTMAINIMGELA